MIGAKSERLVGSKSRRDWIYMGRNSNGDGEVSFHPGIHRLTLFSVSSTSNSVIIRCDITRVCANSWQQAFFFFDGKWNLNIFFFFLLFLRAKWRCFFWYFFNKESTNDNPEFLINKYPLTHDDDTKKIFKNLKFKGESAICRIVGTSLIN